MDLPEAVIFDFSGTLMRIEPPEPWVRAVVSAAGLDLGEEEIASWADRLETAGGHPGGAFPKAIPMQLLEAWENRDLDADKHRAAYTGLIRHAGWPWPELVDALYERAADPAGWVAYPDAEKTLRELKDRGVRTALISNVSWDVRRHLRSADLLRYLDEVILSYEAGVEKPNPAIWALACERLGVEPRRAVMVGDHEDDGGGQAIGIRTFFVQHLPVDQRPHALADVLEQIFSV